MHMDAHIMLKPLQLKGALLDRNHAILYKKQWSSHEYYNWRSHCLQIRTEKDRNNNHSHVNGLMATGESRLDMDCTPAMNPCTFPFNEYSIQGDKVIVLRMKIKPSVIYKIAWNMKTEGPRDWYMVPFANLIRWAWRFWNNCISLQCQEFNQRKMENKTVTI